RPPRRSSDLLLNAGSSSLKATLVESGDSAVLASGMADWAGSETRYRYVGPDGQERSEAVAWKGHARAVQSFVIDLLQGEPAALSDLASLAAVGHRVVHGG